LRSFWSYNKYLPTLTVGQTNPDNLWSLVGWDISVGIATGYGLDGPGIESHWERDFSHLSRLALGPTQPPVNGYRVFPGNKERPGHDAYPSPPSSAVVMKE
jgi:hypothetical protein